MDVLADGVVADDSDEGKVAGDTDLAAAEKAAVKGLVGATGKGFFSFWSRTIITLKSARNE